MKRKWYLILFITQLFACSMEYVEFKPLEARNDEFVVNEMMATPEFQSNLKQVLQFYKVEYREEKAKIFVSSVLWNDQDLMWNYTNKANDKQWLETHRAK